MKKPTYNQWNFSELELNQWFVDLDEVRKMKQRGARHLVKDGWITAEYACLLRQPSEFSKESK